MGKQAAVKRGGWRQWTAAKARRELAAWKTSGLSLATFARRRGLKDTRLRWWQTRLGDWNGDESLARAPTFVPAVVHESAESANSIATVTVRLPNGVVVEVAAAAAVPSGWLTAVVNGLSRGG
jgi:hypothetical protein